MVFWVRRKPASFNPSMLREQFVDAPKTGKGNDTDDGGKDQISDKDRCHNESDSDNKKYRPATVRIPVFTTNHDWMKQADTEERSQSEQNTTKLHITPRQYD